LVLKFGTEDLFLSLRDDIDHVAGLTSNYEIRRADDPEMGRSYFRLIGRGVELTFKANELSSVFLYVTEGPENCGTFSGETDLLKRGILDAKDDKVFCDALEEQGFVPVAQKYPFSVDRLSDKLRLRLEQRQGSVVVLIDDGAPIR
jgi:hypothetical protein